MRPMLKKRNLNEVCWKDQYIKGNLTHIKQNLF